MTFFNRSNLLTDNRKHEDRFVQKTDTDGGPGYLSQFEDLEFDNPKGPVINRKRTRNYESQSRSCTHGRSIK